MTSFSASSSMAKSTDSSFTNTILIYTCVCVCLCLHLCGGLRRRDWIPLQLEFTGNCEQHNMDAKNQTVVLGNNSKCFIHWAISHVSSLGLRFLTSGVWLGILDNLRKSSNHLTLKFCYCN